jgi:hypothetical protein
MTFQILVPLKICHFTKLPFLFFWAEVKWKQFSKKLASIYFRLFLLLTPRSRATEVVEPEACPLVMSRQKPQQKNRGLLFGNKLSCRTFFILENRKEIFASACVCTWFQFLLPQLDFQLT